MSRASCLTLHLARFDSLRTVSELAPDPDSCLLFCGVAADTRAAATEPASHEAFKFLIFGLHANETSAHQFLDGCPALAPWLNEASEVWRAVLQPFRHVGEDNYLDRKQPGVVFDTLAPAPPPDSPLVVVTTVGRNLGEGFDMNRIRDFTTGVVGVRTSMTAVPGLHSQQSFLFPRVLEYDPLTVTFWRNYAATRDFAYGPGVHKVQMEQMRERNLADHTSFTRCIVVRSEGTWHGTDPQFQNL